MGGGDRDQDAGLADFEASETMHKGNVADRELLQCVHGEGLHLRQRHLFVGFVVEIEGSMPARLVADDPLKDKSSAVLATLKGGQSERCIDGTADNRNVAPAPCGLSGWRLVRPGRRTTAHGR